MKAFNTPKQSYYILIVTLFCFLGAIIAMVMIDFSIRAESRPPAFISITNGKGRVEYVEVIHSGKIHGVNKDSVQEVLTKSPTVPTPVLDLKESIYNRNPSFLVWTMLVVIMCGIATGTIPIYLNHLQELIRTFQLKLKSIGIALFFALVLFFMAFEFSTSTGYLYKPVDMVEDMRILFVSGSILNWISILVIGLEIPIFISIFLIGPCADRISLKSVDKKSVQQAFQQFANLRNLLTRSLQVITVLVVFSVLTSTALGESVRSEISLNGDMKIFPKEASYMYGLLFSCFLALIYVPAYFYLNYKEKMMDAYIIQHPFADNEDTQTWLGTLKSTFSNKQSAMDNVKLVLTLMAPLISSFLPEGFQFI